MKKKYDVAIIGGGLGGLTLSIQLANAGISCILFEKKSYPFHRVCGEYISMESSDFLMRLGLDLRTYKCSLINRLQVSSPSGNTFTHRLEQGGIGVSRYRLDYDLALLAKQKGVRLLEGCKVQECEFVDEQFIVKTTNDTYTAAVCVGAWGKQSNLDTVMNRVFIRKRKQDKNYVGVKYHIETSLPNDLIGLHNFKNGYCGISGVEDGKCCLCYLTDSENLKKYQGDIKKMEKEVIMKNAALKAYFESSRFIFNEPLTISQISIGYKSAVENQVLMLGDAAGNIAPLSGNGMSMAMRASAVLFQFIKEYLDKKTSRKELNDRYEHFWKSQFKTRIQISKSLQKLLKNGMLADITIAVLKRVPFLRRALVRSTHGSPF